LHEPKTVSETFRVLLAVFLIAPCTKTRRRPRQAPFLSVQL
jgi:hypothetical protein